MPEQAAYPVWQDPDASEARGIGGVDTTSVLESEALQVRHQDSSHQHRLRQII